MDDPISGLTAERLLETLLFEVGNLLVSSVAYAELAKEKLDSTHAVFSDVSNALQSAERARAVVKRVGDEWRHRRSKPDRSKGTFA